MNADGSAVYPQRFPAKSGDFKVNTLAEEIELVQNLNAESGRHVGIYAEIKRPAWHRNEGVDIAPTLLDTLGKFGYGNRDDPVFVQCFDDAELRRIRNDLNCSLKLVQLIGRNIWREADTGYRQLVTVGGIAELAETVDAIGPSIAHLYKRKGGQPVSSGLAQLAHESGLLVHPYTFRADDLPAGFASFDDLMRFFIDEIGVDGFFTDFPDLALKILAA